MPPMSRWWLPYLRLLRPDGWIPEALMTDTPQTDTDALLAFDAWADARGYTIAFRAPLRRPYVAGYTAALDAARQRRRRAKDEPRD